MAAISARLRTGRGGGDGGFGVIELLVLAPVFILVVMLIVAAGRTQDTGVVVTGAARDGARAASLERTPAAAAAAARGVVADNLAGQGLECVGGPRTSVNTGSLAPGGLVQVSVRCTVNLRDIGFRALPGRVEIDKRATSPIEQYRGAP